MPHEYTRQRQGRDFCLRNNLTETAEEERKKTLAERLEQYRTETERAAAPVDGNEPSKEGRNLI